MRHRADKLIENWCAEQNRTDVNVEAMTQEELVAFIRDNGVTCPGCGKSDFTDIRKFNLMFKTHQGVTEDSSTEVYLRPETCLLYTSTPIAQEHWEYLKKNDPNITKRIKKLLADILEHPYTGIGLSLIHIFQWFVTNPRPYLMANTL